jgi:hypothetical protein
MLKPTPLSDTKKNELLSSARNRCVYAPALAIDISFETFVNIPDTEKIIHVP